MFSLCAKKYSSAMTPVGSKMVYLAQSSFSKHMFYSTVKSFKRYVL